MEFEESKNYIHQSQCNKAMINRQIAHCDIIAHTLSNASDKLHFLSLPRLDYDDTANVIHVSNSLPLEIILRLYVIWRAICHVIISMLQ